MRTLFSLALSGAIAAALTVGASAQVVRNTSNDAVYGLTTGRSAYVAPRGAADDAMIVMGLRVPNGPRTPAPAPTR